VNDSDCSTRSRETSLFCGNTVGESVLGVHIISVQEATRLIQLGARAGLVCQLTGLEKAVANRLYRQLNGKPSPSGLMPFTDAWYLKNNRRMLQAGLVWHLHWRLDGSGRSAARLLIDVYECYTQRVEYPLLDLTRAFVVTRLAAMKIWREYRCEYCGTTYPAPAEITRAVCPGCHLYFRHRCRQCGSQLVSKFKGRRRATYSHCGCALN